MVHKNIIYFSLALLLQSCLMYKDANKENISELKKSSKLSENVEIPEDWILSNNASSENFSLDWINEIHSNELQQLIDEGLQYNANILIAQEKLNQIELAMDIAGSNLYPSVNAISGSSNNLVSGTQIQNLTLQANWELDLWGKNKANKMASVSDYFSATYKNKKLQQTLAGTIAKSYFLNIAGQQQQAKIENYLKITKELEKLYQLRLNVGMANAMDVSNIKAEILTITNYLEKVTNSNAQAKRSLELLLGRYPEGKLNVNNDLKPLTSKLPDSIPLPLLENRPDILARHYQLEAQFYELQEAKAARLPSLGLKTSVGVANTNVAAINGLFSNPLINVGGNLVSPIFNGGKLKKNVAIENSQQKVAVEEYAQTVLNALNEVEAAVANLASIDKQQKYNKEIIDVLEENIQLTKKQIAIGSANNFELLQKERNKLKTEINTIDLQLQDRVERINLYLALGAPSFK